MKNMILVLMLIGSLGYTASLIRNSNIATDAGIAFSKMGSLSNNSTVVTNGSGVITVHPTVNSTTLGYLDISSSLTTLLSNKQGLDAELTAIAGLTSAADKIPYYTGVGTASTITIGSNITFSGGTLSASSGAGSIRSFYVDFGGATEGTNACNASPCTIYRQLDSSGNTDTVSSVTRTGAGNYEINVTAARCSTPPRCIGTSNRAVGGVDYYQMTALNTNTKATARAAGGGDLDGYFICNCAP